MTDLLPTLKKYWGYDQFRPLQEPAMRAVLEHRDSVVVLPTGGGKSLCFQAPALCLPGLAVVISPLISLMKDQVDTLVDSGVPAACINSTMSIDEKRRVAGEIRSGRLKLLYLSPEKLLTPQTLHFLRDEVKPSFFAIDEAHCISDWGHDFRPEYRSLKILKEHFPTTALHAYTATATQRVRDDIVRELQMSNAEILVGSFDRPNLVYRVERRGDRMAQILEVIDRHPLDSGIIYCIRRADVDEVCAALNSAGKSALPYHAGLSDEDRRQNQEAFINDRAKIIVATVAFGMGIDKSDVRYVIHAGAPKSLEGYQQESGRAGRDGLEAECCLFYSPGDFMTWRKLQDNLPSAAKEASLALLSGIERFCNTIGCRHQALVSYFGQSLESSNCGACDACLGERQFAPDSLVIAQKIISCVLRVDQKFGATYVAQVLVGSREQRIVEQGHDKLSTHGLLSQHQKSTVRTWIEQLVEQEFLARSGEYMVLTVPSKGRQALKGEATPQLFQIVESAKTSRGESKLAAEAWAGVDRGLFEDLRALRKQRAAERGLPPFIIFGDATLRDLARRRPSTPEAFLKVHGIGQQKAQQYCEEFLERIANYCRQHELTHDVATDSSSRTSPRTASTSGSATKFQAKQLLLEGKGLDEVCAIVGRARSTVRGYLVECIEQQEISDASHWIEAAMFERIRAAAQQHGTQAMKPIFEALGGEVDYEAIHISLACLRNAPPDAL